MYKQKNIYYLVCFSNLFKDAFAYSLSQLWHVFFINVHNQYKIYPLDEINRKFDHNPLFYQNLRGKYRDFLTLTITRSHIEFKVLVKAPIAATWHIVNRGFAGVCLIFLFPRIYAMKLCFLLFKIVLTDIYIKKNKKKLIFWQ